MSSCRHSWFACIAIVVVSLLTKKPSEEIEKEFDTYMVSTCSELQYH